MAKRPHGDVERTKEDLDEEFYAGIAQMRLEAGREMQRWGYRPKIILPLPLFLPPPSVPARVLPGTEALAAASYATVVHAAVDLVVNASSPAAGAASSSAPAMLDGTASGQDAGTGEAPVPDLNTASGQDAAPVPDLNTASGQDAAPRPERDTASDHDAPPHPERDQHLTRMHHPIQTEVQPLAKMHHPIQTEIRPLARLHQRKTQMCRPLLQKQKNVFTGRTTAGGKTEGGSKNSGTEIGKHPGAEP